MTIKLNRRIVSASSSGFLISAIVVSVVAVVPCAFARCRSDIHQHKYTASDSSHLKSWCPPNCQCRLSLRAFGGTTVDCSGHDLHAIPHSLPSDTTELLMRDNKIAVISNDDLANCRRLLLLDLSHNRVKRIDEDAFASVIELEELSLSYNEIDYGSLPANIFRSLKSLRNLFLDNNSDTARRYPHDAVLASVAGLRLLSIDGIPDTPFGSGFSFLNNLDVLRVTGRLDVVANDTFTAFVDCPVTELQIQSPFLYDLDPMSFSHFPALRTLNLSNNLLGLTNASHGWRGLQFTNISSLVLSKVQPTVVHSDSVSSDFFDYLNRTKIRTLFLDKNNIADIYPALSTSMPDLVYLDLSYNRLTYIAGLLFDLWYLRHLRYLDVSHQARRYVGHTDGRNYYDKASLGSAGNGKVSLSKLVSNGNPKSEKNSTSNFFLDCATPPLTPCLKYWDRKPKYSYPFYVSFCAPVPPKLETAILDEALNLDITDVQDWIVFGGSNLKRLAVGLNGIQKLRHHLIFTQPVAGQTIDLSDNEISCLSPEIFKVSAEQGSKVAALVLAGNNMAAQMEADISGITFKYWNVSVLDLSRNRIKQLPVGVFTELRYIEVLNLSGNSLRLIEFTFNHMRRLKFLDLSYNLITNLDNAVLTNFSASMKSSNLTVNLSGNPIQCSCESRNFLHWIDDNRDRLTSVDDYTCLFHGKVASFSSLPSRILIDLDFQCSKPLVVIVSAVLTGLVLVIVAVAVCCYRYRWELRYLCLKVAQRGQQYQMLVDRDYVYDAFVVYSAEDSHWIINELIPHLEGTTNGEVLNLCVHERDFLAGEYIVDNIWKRMQESRKVILVISGNFVRSNFCNFETNLCRMLSVEKARNLFVPVMLENVGIEQMTDCLQWIVRKMTYTEWPQWAPDREEFWNKLRNSIREPDMPLPI